VVDVSFHPEARAEYLAALDWYQARSFQAAERFETEVERALDLIKSNPTLFPKCDNDHRYVGVHRYPYNLIYQHQPDQVLVVAVAHSKRSAGYWRGRV
jgi:plasmid stabilization system protein ParE